MGSVTQIFRHPIKSHGRESLKNVALSAGKTMPWDRTWAVAHEASKATGDTWASCANFSRGAKAPSLMAINATLDDEKTGTLTLSHPDQPDLTFQPDNPEHLAKFLAWIKPLMPTDRAQSARIIRVPDRGMTDTDYPSISINNHSSNRAVSQKLGTDLSPLRWRGNIWLDGLGPWEEMEWIGKTFQIGTVIFEGVDPIGRCLATTANPKTGKRDADTLRALQDGWGHQDFGIYARVIQGGEINLNDPVAVL